MNNEYINKIREERRIKLSRAIEIDRLYREDGLTIKTIAKKLSRSRSRIEQQIKWYQCWLDLSESEQTEWLNFELPKPKAKKKNYPLTKSEKAREGIPSQRTSGNLPKKL